MTKKQESLFHSAPHAFNQKVKGQGDKALWSSGKKCAISDMFVLVMWSSKPVLMFHSRSTTTYRELPQSKGRETVILYSVYPVKSLD